MPYNNYHNMNNSPARFNTARNFVPGGILSAGSTQGLRNNVPSLQLLNNVQLQSPQQHQQQYHHQQQQHYQPQQEPPLQHQLEQEPPQQHQPRQEPQQQQQNQENAEISGPIATNNVQPQPDTDVKAEVSEEISETDYSPQRPVWMRSKLQGVKKVSNKERRRRQNENLRRLLTPKNALMVLNEIMPAEQQFRVETVAGGGALYRSGACSFRAHLTLHGRSYEGSGESKLSARNAAAEQAIRDVILQRMGRLLLRASNAADAGNAGNAGDDSRNQEGEDDETVPMIQLASYALHKLFSEWEFAGHKVPHLKPQNSVSETGSEAGSEAAAVGGAGRVVVGQAKAKALPADAGAMHPCMLLTYMRPQLEYRELAVEGDRPQSMLFTMAIDVDGRTFRGRASSKKDARRAAAKSACEAIFNVKFQ